ncbi:MAG: long-chain-fatty-acid--CoA ligase [Betaproteobacteria bacterium]
MSSVEDKSKDNYCSREVSTQLNYPDIPLQGLLEATAEVFPGKTALVYGERQITYAQLEAFANKFANALVGLRVTKGDRVALFMPNNPEFVIAFFGILKIGAIITTISPLYREREVEYQLKDSGAETIVALESLCPIVQAVKKKSELRNIIIAGADDSSGLKDPSLEYPLSQMLAKGSTQRPLVNLNSGSDLAALQYTGGTTGIAKGAMLTHRNLVSNAFAFGATIKAAANDVFLTALPLFHIYGMTTSMTTPISVGAKVVVLQKFSPTQALDVIQRHQVSVFCGVPTMYQMLLANPDMANYDLTSIRVCISGASSLPPQIQRSFMEITDGFLAEGYGLTEASPVTHCTPVDKKLPLRIGSIGLPLPDTEARIVDVETGASLNVGEIGELAVKGPQIMRGYWRNPRETDLVLRGGWLLTGDLARIDSCGYFYIVDRKKDLIKTNGYSVYPRELEDILYEHPAVKLSAVVGKPDALSGEVPKAFVVLKDRKEVSEEELMTFVNKKVAPYKAIGEVVFQTVLPLSGVGKVLRRELKGK